MPNATNPLTIYSMNLQVSAHFAKYKAVWIVTTTTVTHVMNPRITSSPTTVSVKNVLLKDAQIASTSLIVAVVILLATTSLFRRPAKNVKSTFVRNVLVGTFVKIVEHGPISENLTKSALIGFSTTYPFSH